MAKKPLPTIEELRQLLRYEPETGRLYWREREAKWFPDGYRSAQGNANNWNAQYAGGEAGAVHKNGYRYFSMPNGRRVLAHRAAYAIHHGEWPEVCDHIDGDPLNNRIENLRSGTQGENLKNARKWSHNTSGRTGVRFDNRRKKWTAHIKVNQKQINLGASENYDEAVKLREAAEMKYGFSERHGR